MKVEFVSSATTYFISKTTEHFAVNLVFWSSLKVVGIWGLQRQLWGNFHFSLYQFNTYLM